MCNVLDSPALLTMNPTCTLVLALVTVLMLMTPAVDGALGIIQSLLRNNLAGPEINFKDAKFPFDPNAGELLSREYQAVNGVLGWKMIERLGLGVDGKTEERRAQQHYRDSIGGLSYKVPGYT